MSPGNDCSSYKDTHLYRERPRTEGQPHWADKLGRNAGTPCKVRNAVVGEDTANGAFGPKPDNLTPESLGSGTWFQAYQDQLT